MPAINKLNKFNEQNLFNLNYKKLEKQVRSAMKKNGDARVEALKDVVRKNFPKIANEYEKIRQTNRAKSRNFMSSTDSDRERFARMMDAPAFYRGFVDIVSEMAQDRDPSFTPTHNLGISKEETVALVLNQLKSYTSRDYHRGELEREGLVAWTNDAIKIRRNQIGKDENRKPIYGDRKYATSSTNMKSGLCELYNRKEMIKDDLKNNGFFWRLFHRKDVKEMRNFIREAEETLRIAEIPEEAINTAISDFDKPIVFAGELDNTKKIAEFIAENKIQEPTKEDFLKPDFRPNVVNINSAYTAFAKVSEYKNKNIGNIPEDVLAVIAMHENKLKLISAYIKAGEGKLEDMPAKFEKMEQDFKEQFPEYKEKTFEEFEISIPQRESVEIDLSPKNKEPLSPQIRNNEAVVRNDLTK